MAGTDIHARQGAALRAAVMRGHTWMVKLLLNHGAHGVVCAVDDTLTRAVGQGDMELCVLSVLDVRVDECAAHAMLVLYSRCECL